MAEPALQAGSVIRRRAPLVIAGGAIGVVAAGAVAGIAPAQAVLVLALATGLATLMFTWSLPAVTATVLPVLAVVSNLPAPLTIAGRNLRYIFIVAPVLVALWLVRAAGRGRAHELGVPHSAALGGLWGMFALATVLRSPAVGTGLGTVTLLGLCLAVYAMVAWAVRQGGGRDLERATMWLCLGVGLYVAGGILILLGHWLGVLPPGFGVEQRDIADLAFAEVGGRLVTPAGFWTVTGSYFAATAVLGIGLFLAGSAALRGAGVIGMVGGVTGMVMSASRGPLVGFVAGLAVLLALAGRGHIMRLFWRLTLVVGIATVPAVVYVGISPGVRAAVVARLATLFDLSAGTTVDRLVLWGWMLSDVRARPILGSGADAYRIYRDPGYPAESFPIEILHSAGLIGFACFTAWLVGLFVRGWRVPPRNAPVTVAALAAFVGLNVAVATNPGAWGTFYWVLAGLAAAAPAVEVRGS